MLTSVKVVSAAGDDPAATSLASLFGVFSINLYAVGAPIEGNMFC